MLKIAGLCAGLLVAMTIGSLAGCRDDGGNVMSRTEKVDINEMGPGGHYHMIFRRIEEDDYESLEDFLKAGVDVNIRGYGKQTPTIWAAQSGSWKMVEMLINYGADLSLADQWGHTVADTARGSVELKNVKLDSPVGESFQRVVKILKERGLY